MNIKDTQVLLASAGLYAGGIDGDAGPQTMAAVQRVLGGAWASWPQDRLLIAAAQKLLNDLGFEAGNVDGYAGHNTENALAAYRYFLIHGVREVVDRTPRTVGSTASGLIIPHQRDVEAFYGTPGDDIRRQLTYVVLPFELRLDYQLDQRINRLRVHEKCAVPLLGALTETHEYYGIERMRELGLDRYAGGHMHRKMRGGSKWSMHAYGCATDWFARPNGLRTRCPQALFCGSDYKPFLDIMESHGWLSAIRLWGADAMHFQMARL